MIMIAIQSSDRNSIKPYCWLIATIAAVGSVKGFSTVHQGLIGEKQSRTASWVWQLVLQEVKWVALQV